MARFSKKESLDFSDVQYHRVKPESEPEYIPFTFDDAKDLVGRCIKSKDGTKMQTIVHLNQNHVFAGVGQMDYEWLLEDYTFLDGSPCGKNK